MEFFFILVFNSRILRLLLFKERHWKQMQALRQQQSQLQDPQSKDILNSPQHSQVPFSPTGSLRPIRHPGSEMMGGTDNIRQPLHVSMPHVRDFSIQYKYTIVNFNVLWIYFLLLGSKDVTAPIPSNSTEPAATTTSPRISRPPNNKIRHGSSCSIIKSHVQP